MIVCVGNGAQMVAVRAAVGNLDHGMARLEHADARADGARVRHREAEQLGEQPRPAGQRREAAPKTEKLRGRHSRGR
jgi:hypothetical protein